MDAPSHNILEKGLNFTIVPRRIPFEDLICNIEFSIKNLTPKCAEEVRQDCVIMLRKAKSPACNISREEWAALINLKKNKSIKILKAEKGTPLLFLTNAIPIRKYLIP